MTHEQYEELADFETLEPTGWQATRIMTTRLSYITAATRSQKRLREKAFDVVIGGQVQSPETERARWEAFSVRQQIAEGNK